MRASSESALLQKYQTAEARVQELSQIVTRLQKEMVAIRQSVVALQEVCIKYTALLICLVSRDREIIDILATSMNSAAFLSGNLC